MLLTYGGPDKHPDGRIHLESLTWKFAFTLPRSKTFTKKRSKRHAKQLAEERRGHRRDTTGIQSYRQSLARVACGGSCRFVPASCEAKAE